MNTEWGKIRESTRKPVWGLVGYSIGGPVWGSIKELVRDSVRDVVWDSI